MHIPLKQQTAALATPPRAKPMQDMTIAQILQTEYPNARLRKQFMADPYLDQVTLGELLGSPFALHEFLERCMKLPHCGETSINRLRDVIKKAANASVAS
jgi:hypothetical protein